MNENDLISVIIPAYNAENYIEECLKSIYAQEVEVPLEIIVVNDGSTDNTGHILDENKHKITIINQPNSGVCKSRNAGFRAAKGNFIASLDADDLYLPKKLSKQFSYLKKNLSKSMVFCKVQQFVSPELFHPGIKIGERLEILTAFNFQGVMFKSSVFDEIGYIDESIRSTGEFLDWFARAKEKNVVNGVIEEVLLKRRIHDSNYGKLNKGEQQDFLKVLRSKLERERLKV